MEGWRPVFQGDIDGRPVLLKRYNPSGELCVETVQIETETTEAYSDGDNFVFPAVISAGSRIDIEGSDPDELERELRASGFSETGAREITRHARIPSV